MPSLFVNSLSDENNNLSPYQSSGIKRKIIYEKSLPEKRNKSDENVVEQQLSQQLAILRAKNIKLKAQLKEKELKLKTTISKEVYLDMINRIKNLESSLKPHSETIDNALKLLKNGEASKIAAIQAEIYDLRKKNYDLNHDNECLQQLVANFRASMLKEIKIEPQTSSL
uniref:Uncharacterized protein n=1 Tax=Panagrolaimus sp. JU765 TaxID=591449 RepID=A0AC34PYG8_9BILA